MITFDDPLPEPPPPEPKAPAEPAVLPKTPAHFELLRERAGRGEPLFQAGDLLHHPSQRRNTRRLRNGYEALVGERPVVEVEADPGQKPSAIVDRGNAVRTAIELALPQLATLGQRLRDLRRRKKMSLGQVSLRTGLARQTVSHLETGRRRQPGVGVLWLLAEAYGVSLDELVGRS